MVSVDATPLVDIRQRKHLYESAGSIRAVHCYDRASRMVVVDVNVWGVYAQLQGLVFQELAIGRNAGLQRVVCLRLAVSLKSLKRRRFVDVELATQQKTVHAYGCAEHSNSAETATAIGMVGRQRAENE